MAKIELAVPRKNKKVEKLLDMNIMKMEKK